MISPMSTRHVVKAAAGKVLVAVSSQYYLRQTVHVEGSSSEGFAWAAPGLGKLDVRSSQETCDVMIGDQKVGNPPLKIDEIAAGQYRVDISCGGAIVRSMPIAVTTGETGLVAIK